MTPGDRVLLVALRYQFTPLCTLPGSGVVRCQDPARPASDYLLREGTGGEWRCDCRAFDLAGSCKHALALTWRLGTVADLEQQEREERRESERRRREERRALQVREQQGERQLVGAGRGWQPGEEW